LAGVCAALARYSGRRVGTTRLAFVFGIPFFGITLIAYLACWLILPDEGGRERSRTSVLSSGLVNVLLGFGGLLAMLTLAVAAATATVFGLGLGVVIVAAAVLAMGVIWMREANPAWMLLPLAALVLPAAVIAGTNVHLDRQIGDINVAPQSRAELNPGGYQTGLGTLFVDLRHYDWTDGATVPLRISAGLGRSVVALPTNRCVAVRVHYDTHAGLLHGLADALGVDSDDSAGANVFGQSVGVGQGEVAPTVHGRIPTVSIDFSSQGGELYVRDYPDGINPPDNPGWPGVAPSAPELEVSGLTASEARRDRRFYRKIERRLPGPCSTARRG
jgi:phage shock protein PspC (stress-responsive transcriptional regulator)